MFACIIDTSNWKAILIILIHALLFRHKNTHSSVYKQIFTPSPHSLPCSYCLKHSNHITTSSLTPHPPHLSCRADWPPTSLGLLTSLGSCNDDSPYVCAAAAALNREDKCGIFNILIIVSLPLSAVPCCGPKREMLTVDLSVHI